MTARPSQLRAVVVALAAGMVFATVPAAAHWSTPASGYGRAHARATFPVRCTAGSLTLTSDLDGYTAAGGGTSYTINLTDVEDDATTSGDDRRRSFFHFPTPAVPSGCAVTSAVLSIRQLGGTFNGALVAQKIASTWNETTAKPAFAIPVTGSTFTFSAFCTTPCARTVTVTSAVVDWITTPASNFGLRVTFANESSATTSTHTLNFGTREHSTATNRPTLTVVYS